ncbi:MAG: hypothetical protein KDB22_08205 [Planctomycetales bacterium]|nr:hypothetical protein [Planctomycetales bacterium]
MIGGFALNLYQNPRATGDIDFLIETSVRNEKNLRTVLIEFGFGSTLPPPSSPLIEEGKILMLGRSPFRIDLLTKIDGVTFSEVARTCLQLEIDSLQIPVISPRMLLRNKESTGRAKDEADAIELRKWIDSGGDLGFPNPQS